jgi:putative DNA-invertase from lambdoid prophage Rac
MTLPSKRAVVYLRVSTLEQSCDLQQRELLQFLNARDWQLQHTYEDTATGTNGNRPQLQQLLKDARERKFDVLICWKLDRLFRSLKGLVTTLAELNELGIEFISLKDNIDLSTSTGRLMMHIVGAFAQFEADIIKERVRAGLANAVAQGKRLGRPKLRNDESIHQLRAQGLSIRAIAKQLNVSTTAIQRGLRVTKTPKQTVQNSQ